MSISLDNSFQTQQILQYAEDCMNTRCGKLALFVASCVGAFFLPGACFDPQNKYSKVAADFTIHSCIYLGTTVAFTRNSNLEIKELGKLILIAGAINTLMDVICDNSCTSAILGAMFSATLMMTNN